MTQAERERLVAPCGIDCGICELQGANARPERIEAMVARGIPREKLPCKGCRNIDGNCPVIQGQCATYACASQHAVEFCFQCAQFPCVRLHPSADRADVLPHNLKVYNLSAIRRDGLGAFIQASAEIQKRYYKGKMAVGKGPQLPA